jgi:hypothetical protein
MPGAQLHVANIWSATVGFTPSLLDGLQAQRSLCLWAHSATYDSLSNEIRIGIARLLCQGLPR